MFMNVQPFYPRWKLEFSWLPRKCNLSGQWFWLIEAYRGYYLCGTTEVVGDRTAWRSPSAHTIYCLEHAETLAAMQRPPILKKK